MKFLENYSIYKLWLTKKLVFDVLTFEAGSTQYVSINTYYDNNELSIFFTSKEQIESFEEALHDAKMLFPEE